MNFPLQQRPVVRSTATELVLLAGVLATAFTYLEVPLWNSLLFGVAVISQAAFGTVVLSRILQGVLPSLLLLLGPGLILGGALSFALFQIVARGVIGLIVVAIVGFTSVAHLVRSPNWQPLGSERLWVLGQVVGLAALALTWEFRELLPVAIAFFALGFLTGDMFTTPRSVKQVAVVIAAAVIITPLFFRQDYWWMVTDDYNFLEMLSQHLTRSSPLADFGVLNFSRYHWFSYGWNGLLNQLGGQPEPFTTLTRVTPLVYSIALAGSLIHMARHLHEKIGWTFGLVPVWTIFAINPLDWSGTSTAGVFAVIAATAAAALLALNTTQSFVRRAVIYLLFGIIVSMTKLPSIFTVLIIIFSAEIFMITRRFTTRLRILVSVFSGAVASLGVIPLIVLTSRIVGGFTIAEINLGLGQLSTFGPQFAYLLLSLQRLWLIVPVTVVIMLSLRKKVDVGPPMNFSLSGLAPITLLGVLMDTLMTGNTNAFEYFSRPMYFAASFALVAVIPFEVSVMPAAKELRIFLLLAAGFVSFGYLWVRLSLADQLWPLIGSQLFEWNLLKVTLLQYVTFDRRIGATVLAVMVLVASTRIKLLAPQVVVASLFASLSILTLYSLKDSAITEFQRERQPADISANIGSPDFIAVGNWLASNSKVSDVVATNYMLGANSGVAYSDYGLAALSEREYLLVGVFQKWFDPESFLHNDALNAVLSFSSSPTLQLSQKLQEFGVQWIVIDQSVVARKSWTPFAEIVFETEQLLILKLQTT